MKLCIIYNFKFHVILYLYIDFPIIGSCTSNITHNYISYSMTNIWILQKLTYNPKLNSEMPVV